ncbi:tail fiber assembly protein [Serratia fonticola]
MQNSAENFAALHAWERYSVLLSRVNSQDAAEITWPDKPV